MRDHRPVRCRLQPLATRSAQGRAGRERADTYCWNELLSSDIEGAEAFHSQVFGWAYDESSMGPGFSYWVIRGGDAGGLGGLMSRPENYPAQAPDSWAVYFWVADLAARTARATELGATVATEAMRPPPRIDCAYPRGVARVT